MARQAKKTKLDSETHNVNYDWTLNIYLFYQLTNVCRLWRNICLA